jgi:hypothetical protein
MPFPKFEFRWIQGNSWPNLHYEKNGVSQLGLKLIFELQWPYAIHYISTLMSVIKQIPWIVKDAIHHIYALWEKGLFCN